MDFVLAQKKLIELTNKQVELSQQYATARESATEAKVRLDILLVAKLPEIRADKPNVGYDMAVRMLMEDSREAQSYFAEAETNRAKYKGLERLIEAHKNKLIALQSIVKTQQHGERYGA